MRTNLANIKVAACGRWSNAHGAHVLEMAVIVRPAIVVQLEELVQCIQQRLRMKVHKLLAAVAAHGLHRAGVRPVAVVNGNESNTWLVSVYLTSPPKSP